MNTDHFDEIRRDARRDARRETLHEILMALAGIRSVAVDQDSNLLIRRDSVLDIVQQRRNALR